MNRLMNYLILLFVSLFCLALAVTSFVSADNLADGLVTGRAFWTYLVVLLGSVCLLGYLIERKDYASPGWMVPGACSSDGLAFPAFLTGMSCLANAPSCYHYWSCGSSCASCSSSAPKQGNSSLVYG